MDAPLLIQSHDLLSVPPPPFLVRTRQTPNVAPKDEESPQEVISIQNSSSSLTSSTECSNTTSIDGMRVTVVIPMYREVAEVKTALRCCFDLRSYGYGCDFSVDILVVIEGCTAGKYNAYCRHR